MAPEPIQEGMQVFATDGEPAVGAVREVSPSRQEIVVYIENAGDFVVPVASIADVHSGKVILNRGKLDERLRQAIGHAHDSEDPNLR